MKKLFVIFRSGVEILLLLVLVLTVAIGYFGSGRETPGELKLFAISSGSMGKTIPAGSFVLVKPQSEYKVDDIITYYTRDNQGNRDRLPTTHRIVGVKEGENLGFETKGDANETKDPFITPAQSVIGKVIFTLPWLGQFYDFINSRNGFIFLVVIPATILAYEEIMNLKREIGKMWQKRQEKKKTVVAEAKIKESPIKSKKIKPKK